MQVRAWLTIVGLACFLFMAPASAGDFEEGLAAWKAGNYTAALKIWTPLAEQDHAAAEYYLALMHAKGQGVTRDDSKAIQWYRRAASHRYTPAQLAIAVSYDEGRGVPQSPSKAMKWYRLAGQQGDVTAQVTLGLIYGTGRGVPENPWQAAKWYELAAEQGNAIAQNNLGHLYARGQGVSRDALQAYLWFSLAAAGGEAGAEKSRDAIAKQLTPEQLSRAEKRIARWKAAQALNKAARCQGSSLSACP